MQTLNYLQPQENDELIKKHSDLIEMLLATVFPPTSSEKDNLYAVSFPLSSILFTRSNLFQLLFMKPGTNEVNIPEDQLGRQLSAEKLLFAYNIILKKYFGHDAADSTRMTYPFVDPATGFTKYLELNLDAVYRCQA